MKKLFLVAIAALLLTASACSKRVLTSSEVKVTTDRVLIDTLVKVKIAVPIKSISVDTTLKNVKILLPKGTTKVVIKKENKDMKVQVTIDSLGRVTIDATTKADSLEAIIKLQNEKITILKESKEIWERKETGFKKVIRSLGIYLALLIAALLAAAVIIWKLKKAILP